MDSSHKTTWETYEKAWAEADPTKRLRLIEQSVAPQCVYTDPQIQAHGYEALSAYMEECLKQIPSGGFVTTAFATHHDQCFASWNMVDGAGATVIPGDSFARFGPDGRLVAMTGFFSLPSDS